MGEIRSINRDKRINEYTKQTSKLCSSSEDKCRWMALSRTFIKSILRWGTGVIRTDDVSYEKLYCKL